MSEPDAMTNTHISASRLIEFAGQCNDPTFRDKFIKLPNIIEEWISDFGGLAGKRVLDFGCGEGITALGIATTKSPSLVIGVDINRESDECVSLARRHLTLENLPSNLYFEEITRGQISSYEEFDLVYSWSVFEHIEQDLFDSVIQGLRSKLKPRGHLFIQIQPLYFSPTGSHLWALGYEKWEHLTKQTDYIHAELFKKLDQKAAADLWSTFITLNKITSPTLKEKVCAQGFKLVKEYETKSEIRPTSELLHVYSESALVTDQVVLLLQKY